MSVREYVGARYVPLFADPIDWDATSTYEPLTVVLYQGNSYTSRQYVPSNIDISNTTYWAQTGNYNAQIEQYRTEVQNFDSRITSAARDASNALSASTENASDIVDLTSALETTTTTANNALAATVTNASGISAIEQNVETISGAVTENTDAIAAETLARENADTTLTNSVNQLNTLVTSLDKQVYIDRLSGDPEFVVINRFVLGGSYNTSAPYYGRAACQGSCVIKINNVDYWVCATGPDGGNHVVVVRMSDNVVISDTILNLGHANGCSYDGDNIVMFANHIDNTIVFVDFSTPSTPAISRTVSTPNGESIVCACYVGNTGKIALVHGQLSGYNSNVSNAVIYNDSTFEGTTETVNFSYNSNLFSGWQSVSCDGSYFYIAHSGPEAIVVLNRTSGALETIMHLRPTYQHINMFEIESAFIYENKLYISNYNAMTTSKRKNYVTGAPSIQTSELLCADIVGNTIQSKYSIPSVGHVDSNNNYVDANVYRFQVSGFEELYASDSSAIKDSLICPAVSSNSKWLFIDDIFAALRSASVSAASIELQFYTDYEYPMLLVGVPSIRFAGYSTRRKVGGVFCANGTKLIVGGNIDFANYYRSSTKALPLTILDSICTIQSSTSTTYDAAVGFAYQVQANRSVLIADSDSPSFTYGLVSSISNLT